MFTVTRPLSYDSVEEIVIESVELANDKYLVIAGHDTSKEQLPVKVSPLVNNAVAKDIVYTSILAQLQEYRNFPDELACINAIRDHKGDVLKVKLTREAYEDPLTLQMRTRNNYNFNINQF